jgi:hypothetical protein
MPVDNIHQVPNSKHDMALTMYSVNKLLDRYPIIIKHEIEGIDTFWFTTGRPVPVGLHSCPEDDLMLMKEIYALY